MSYANIVAQTTVVAYIKKTPRVNKPRGSLPANRSGVRYIYDYATGFVKCTEVEHISFYAILSLNAFFSRLDTAYLSASTVWSSFLTGRSGINGEPS